MINFNSAYNRKEYIDFLRNNLLPADFTLVEDDRDLLAQRNYTYKRLTQAIKLGECKSLDLAVYEMHHDSDNDPRVSLTNEAFKVIEMEYREFALIFFIKKDACQFRFSLIHCQTERDQTNKVITKLSNPRRYSFILGQDAKVHTPEQYLIKSGRISDCEDLKKRFSIEVVNKEFYQDIQKMFYRLIGGNFSDGHRTQAYPPELKLPGTIDNKVIQEFGVRLIGRLVFCWFLRKKKSSYGLALIPEELLSSSAVKENYYHKVIEPLFFQLLNTKIDKRREEYQVEPYSFIPFLNGGLFDPNLHKDFYDIDDNGVSLHQNTLKISDSWFSDFLKILETYNFTIDENTSIDIDLSVDPEMLGRIFENLLAEINPETGETARKSTGSFYTPREIVEYMVDESLTQYLITNTNINEEKIRNLLDYNIDQVPVSKIECEQVLTAIDELKVLDPACGSGAYPMGILQKLILVLQKVDPDSLQWVIMQLDKIPNSQVRKTIEEQLMKENWRYKHKMGIIQNAIYGVDIQTIATEISKLRLFLTLIVDEEIDDSLSNRGVHPLPNLSFKFVTANSLISLPEPTKDSQATIFSLDGELDPLMDKLECLREEFFYATGSDKYAVEEKFKETQTEISEIILHYKADNPKAIALANWKPFGDEQSPWFDKKLMFGIEDGFDIVIGNPPYVDSETMVISQPLFREQLRASYKSAKGNWDLFVVFIEKGIILTKLDGFITFIVPNKLISAKYTIEVRKLLHTLNINELSDYSQVDVFKEADVYPIVFSVWNNKNKSEVKTKVMNDLNNTKTKFIIHPEVFYNDIFWDKYFFREEITNIAISISSNQLLGNSNFKVLGAATVSEAYLIKEHLHEHDPLKEDQIKLINTGTIDPYKIFWGIRKTRYIKSAYIRPVIKASDLTKISSKRVEQSRSFKLVIAGMARILEVFYDSGEYLAGKSTIIVLHDDEMSLKALCGILNSKAVSFWFTVNYNSLSMAGGYFNIGAHEIKSIPIPIDNLNIHKILLSNLVNNIINDNKNMEDTSQYENQIDLIVYKLYELTYQEAKAIDPNIDDVLSEFKLTTEQYENMSIQELAKLSECE